MTEKRRPPVYKDALIASLRDHTATIGVIGLGYVGLPFVLNGLREGFKVIGFDTDSEKVRALNSGEQYLAHFDHAPLQQALADHSFTPTSDYALIAECSAIVICVPTPLGPHREPDLSFINGTIDAALPYVRAGQVISLESSTYPGTTRECLGERLAAAGFSIGQEIFVVYSPEREDPGNKRFQTHTIPKIVGGMTESCRDVGQALYEQIVEEVVPVSSPRVAEMTKLLENIYRAVNIGLVNELKLVAEALNIDIWEVIDAASTKPFGFEPFYPGPGLGGHCIPIDPFYLTWKAKEVGISTRFIELAGEINSRMPGHVIDKTMRELNAEGVAAKGSRVLVLGASYKKNVGDLRESPALAIIEGLRARRAHVDYSDPHVQGISRTRHYDFSMSSVHLSPDLISRYDAVVLVTDHDEFDYDMILKHARLLIDTRGRFRNGPENVVPG